MKFGQDHYRLNGHDVEHFPVETEADLIRWAVEIFGGDRQVALTELGPGVQVSTVFLGLDHRFCGDGPPLVFETMVFTDYGGDEIWRWSTWDEAMVGHECAVAALKAKVRRRRRRESSPVHNPQA